jgi:hypothetical protein
MGNIISNTGTISGNSRGFIGEDGQALNAFAQNMTDILLELDMLNTGNYNQAVSPQNGPRSEFDYSYNAYNTNPGRGVRSPDVDNNIGRPVNTNGAYVDILGIPYTTTEKAMPGVNNSTSTILLPNYRKTPKDLLNTSSFYNMKRGVCNKSNRVPVSLVGIDLPGDDPDLISWNTAQKGNNTYVGNIKSNQINGDYKLPTNANTSGSNAISDMVNNCLTSGKIDDSTKPPTIPIPTTIPDLTSTSGQKLNDYSIKNIYDKPLSDDCIALLDSMVIDSYTTPKISEYSKWTTNDKQKLSGIVSGSTQIVHDYASKKVGLITGFQGADEVPLGDTRIPAGFTADKLLLYGQGINGSFTTGTGATVNSAQSDMNLTCQELQQDMCSWYYYYDINDGFKVNNRVGVTDSNLSKFSNNLQFLQSHIPDCRCESFQLTSGTIVNPDPNDTAGGAYNSFYQGNKCNADFNYGHKTDAGGNSNPASQFATGSGTIPDSKTNLYNATTNNATYIAYRRQFDPTGVWRAGTSDGIWGMIRNKNRITPVSVQNYTCNMSITNNIKDVGGNVIIGGLSMTCGLPQACSGTWTDSSATCNATCNADGSGGSGNKTQTYQVRTPAANGGAACEFKTGDTRVTSCTGISCPPVASQGAYASTWSACMVGTTPASCNQPGIQKQNWIETVPAKYRGTTPEARTQQCTGDCSSLKKDCVGRWTNTGACNAACGQAGVITQTYSIEQVSAYGGASCPAAQGDVRTQPCSGPVCAAVNCIGNWVTTPNSTCTGVCGTNNGTGTINQTWQTVTAASNGGSACPSATRNQPCAQTCSSTGTSTGGGVSLGATGAAAAAAAADASSTGSASSNINPTFNAAYIPDPSKTTITYTIPIEANTPALMPYSTVSATMTVNTALVATFANNYQFVLYLTSDVSKVTVCPKFSGSTCPTTTNNGNVIGACSPYIITLPFMYGTTTTTLQYELGLRNIPENYTNTLSPPPRFNIPLKLKQYSMSISSATVTIISGNPFMAIKINPNTSDLITGLTVRIILTPTSGSSPVITKYYADLFSALSASSNTLTIGGSTASIQPIVYNYKIMLAEVPLNTMPITYKGGYQMNYDQSFSVASQGSVDFSQISSTFSNVSLQYMEYNNGNNILNVIPNDTLLIGSTVLFSWIFNSVDSSINSVKIYYDTNSSYTPSSDVSSTSVLILSSGLGTMNNTTNNYTNTINFICPFINTSQPVIFYASANSTSKTIYSAPIKVSLPQVSSSPSINNWKIITNNTSSDMATLPSSSLAPLLGTNQTIATINNYFSRGKNANSKYIIYNPGNATWYSSNATPVPFTSTTSTGPVYTLFQNPNLITPIPTVKITNIVAVGTSSNTSIYTSSTSGAITLELGAEITLSYQITNITLDTDFQLIIANKKVLDFPFKVGSSSTGSISFNIFGDLTVVSPTLVLTSYGTWNSTPIPIILNNLGAIRKTLSLPTATPASSVAFTNNILNPAIEIVSANTDTVISNMSATYGIMSENQYFTQLSRFSSPLTIKNANFIFNKMDFSLPFSFIIHSALTEGFSESSIVEPFINARELYLESKKPKKQSNKKQKTYINSNLIESFSEHLSSTNNNLTIDTLTLDFSLSTLETLNNIELMFSGYTTVTITNLILVFGTLSIDNKKFNINIIPNSIIPTVFNVNKITFIGTLSSKLYIISTVPGLSTVNYSVNRLVNNNYALVLPLVYSNGIYTLPETYQSQLNTILNPTSANNIPDPVKPPVFSQAPSTTTDFLTGLELATGLSSTILLSIAGAILLLILYLIYVVFIKSTPRK